MAQSTFTGWLIDAITDLARLETRPDADAMTGALGLTSLALVTLQYRLQVEHGAVAPLEDLASNQTIGALADQLAALRATEDMA